MLRYTALSEAYDEQARNRVTTVRYEPVTRDGEAEVAEREWLIHWWTAETFTKLCAQAGVGLRSLDVSDNASDLTAVIGRA